MRRPFLRVLALGAAAALVLGACGGDEGGEGGEAGEERPTTVAVDTYADDVCKSLSFWVQDIQDRAATITEGIDPADLKAGKERLAQFISDTVQGTEELIADVEAAGVPDTDGGEQAANQIQSGLKEVKTILEGAEDDIAALPTNDPQAFGTGAQQIASSLQEATAEAAASIDAANSDELTEAFGKNERCAEYGSTTP